MGKLYFGGALSTLEEISLSGFQPGQLLSENLLAAMIEARNSVGLNRRFKPAVLVIEAPTSCIVRESSLGFQVSKSFYPEILQILLIKIDFTVPNLVRVDGSISPYYLSQRVQSRQVSAR